MLNITLGLFIYRHFLIEETSSKNLLNQEVSGEVELILVGCISGKLKFIQRDVIPINSSLFSLESTINQKIKALLKSCYQHKKIHSGRLRVGLSSSNVKSFVLGNLLFSAREKDPEFPFVLAHLKQHLGENLQELSVDFKKISDNQVWIVTCPREKVYDALSWELKTVPLDYLEPSMNSLLRLLQRRESPQESDSFIKENFGFFWMDAVFEKKTYRLSLCHGLEVIWDKVLESFDLGVESSLSSSEIVSILIPFLQVALEEYESDAMAFSKMGPISRLYLWIEPAWEKELTEFLNHFFKERGWQNSQCIVLVPAQFELNQADEFVSLGLALR